MNNKSRSELLDTWLEKNVMRYGNCRRVTLLNFQLCTTSPPKSTGQLKDISNQQYAAWEAGINAFAGSCKYSVRFDDELCPVRFGYGIEWNGHPEVEVPMFHSPIGVPCSYSKVELAPRVSKAINRGLRQIVPFHGALAIVPESEKLLIRREQVVIDFQGFIDQVRDPAFELVIEV